MANPTTGGQAEDLSMERPVTYTCGDCASDVTLTKAQPLRCLQCGHRILHKKRTTR
jgi:DNA-directed RNA polymerase I, II, and III subunit RPABC4